MEQLLALVWDPSIGIDIGPITLRYYSLFFALGFILGYWVEKKIFLKENLPLNQLDALFIYVFVGTFIGARLGHVFFYDWAYFRHHLAEIFLPFQFEPEFRFTGFQGLASHGAAIGILLSVWIYAKKYNHPFLWVMDRLVIPVALAGVCIRLGNLMNSEIVGMPTGSSYGFIFKQNGENFDRHPSQLYEATAYLLSFGFLWFSYLKGKRKYLGYIFGCFLVLIFGFRFFIEFLKDVQVDFEKTMTLDMGQWLSIPFILVGIYLIVTAKKRLYKLPVDVKSGKGIKK